MPLMTKAQEVIKDSLSKKKKSPNSQSLLSKNKETSSSTTGKPESPQRQSMVSKTREPFPPGRLKIP